MAPRREQRDGRVGRRKAKGEVEEARVVCCRWQQLWGFLSGLVTCQPPS